MMYEKYIQLEKMMHPSFEPCFNIKKKKDFFTSAFTYFALTANSNDSGLKVCLLFLKFYYFLITYEICNKRESIVGGSVVLHDVEYKKTFLFVFLYCLFQQGSFLHQKKPFV